MDIVIDSNRLCDESQTVNLEGNILTLIGGNGSGKSTFLRSVFSKYINDEDYNIISFSSGQNELFTSLFNDHKRRNKRFTKKEENETINSFYFNYDWVRTLVFFASIFKPHGNVRQFLIKNGYIIVNELNQDISSKFSFTFRIRKDYKKRITNDYLTEAGDNYNFDETKLVRKTSYHETIERIINAFGFDFFFDDEIANSMRKRKLVLDFSKAKSIFQTKDPFDIFTFWALATTGWGSFFEISETKLHFDNNLEFRNLSDGEYQLLSVYALMDLFDKENTIFLFDEIDSHLHYRNIEKLWTFLNNNIKGKIITTTHIVDSIILSKVENIKLVNEGKIENNFKLNELLIRLDTLSHGEEQKKKIASQIEYLALVDDKTDWIIFTKLAKKKLGDNYDSSKMNKVQFIKCEGGYAKEGDDFGGSKKEWVKDFLKINKRNDLISTKEIFLICDRDVLPINNMIPLNDPRAQNDPKSLIQITGLPCKNTPNFKKNKQPHLLSWRRREIENYLFTFSVLFSNNLLAEVEECFGKNGTPNQNDKMDGNETIRDTDYKPILKECLYKRNNITGEIDLCRWDYEKLSQIIEVIQVDEISDDILYMYNYIVSKIS